MIGSSTYGPYDPNHYEETTHTASGLSATVNAGGTYSATCATCHPGALSAQHQNVAASGDGDVTCVECHTANTAVTAVITTGWSTKTCAACHTAGVLPTMVAHATTAPAVSGTEAEGAGSCAKSGCHATTDMHALHAYNATRCGQRLCDGELPRRRTRRRQAHRQVLRRHRRLPHGTAPARRRSHTTFASTACSVCHAGAGDLKLTHGGAASCAICHGNAELPDAAHWQARVRKLPQRRRCGHAPL